MTYKYYIITENDKHGIEYKCIGRTFTSYRKAFRYVKKMMKSCFCKIKIINQSHLEDETYERSVVH